MDSNRPTPDKANDKLPPSSDDAGAEKSPITSSANKEGKFEKLYAGRAALSAFYSSLNDHGVFATAPHVYEAIQAHLSYEDPFAPSMAAIDVQPHELLDIEAKMRAAVSNGLGEGPHGAITTQELQSFLTNDVLVGALEHLHEESRRHGGMPDQILQASERQLTELLSGLDSRIMQLGQHFPEGSSMQAARVCSLQELYQHHGAGNIPITGTQLHELVTAAISGLESPICGTAPDQRSGHGLTYTKDNQSSDIGR